MSCSAWTDDPVVAIKFSRLEGSVDIEISFPRMPPNSSWLNPSGVSDNWSPRFRRWLSELRKKITAVLGAKAEGRSFFNLFGLLSSIINPFRASKTRVAMSWFVWIRSPGSNDKPNTVPLVVAWMSPTRLSLFSSSVACDRFSIKSKFLDNLCSWFCRSSCFLFSNIFSF